MYAIIVGIDPGALHKTDGIKHALFLGSQFFLCSGGILLLPATSCSDGFRDIYVVSFPVVAAPTILSCGGSSMDGLE